MLLISVKTKELNRYDSMNNCLVDVATYDYSVMVGTVYIEGVLFAFLALTIMDYSPLPSWSAGYLNLEYMIYGFGDHVALHCTALHGIWSYVANLWLRPYWYNIDYWA